MAQVLPLGREALAIPPRGVPVGPADEAPAKAQTSSSDRRMMVMVGAAAVGDYAVVIGLILWLGIR